MNTGFIYLHRKLKDHWIWKNPFYFQWFIYFLFRANFKDNKILMGSDLIDIKKGEFITSIDKLSDKLIDCSPKKLRTFLKLLEKDSMIIKSSTSKWTKITVCNYDSYQDKGQTKDKQKTNKRQTEGNQRAIENNVKEGIKKVNKVKYKYTDFSLSIKEKIEDFIKYRNKIKKPFKTERGFNSFQKELFKLSEGKIETAKLIIDQSLDKEWQGIFELKEKFNNKKAVQKDQSDFTKKDEGWPSIN